jgi:hypothetical protein
MTGTAAPHGGVPPLGASAATTFGSGAQASNSTSIARPTGRASLRVWSQVTTEEPELARKRRRSSTGAGSSGFGLTHLDNQGRRDAEGSRNTRNSPQPKKSSGTHVSRLFYSGCKHSQYVSCSARLLRTSI